jgi:hypothetical protein
MRLERKLHDGASLRISAMSLRLGLLRGDEGDDGGASFQRAVGELQDELHTVLDELRAVADSIYPPLLDQAGLGPALRELAVHSGHQVTVQAVDERFGTAVEGAAYFAVADCLAAWLDGGADGCAGGGAGAVGGASAVGGAGDGDPVRGGGPVHVNVRRDDRYLVVTMTGVPSCHAVVMADHAEAMGGHVEVKDTAIQDGGERNGGSITVRIPCA